MLLNKTRRAPVHDYTVINLACSIANFSNIARKKRKCKLIQPLIITWQQAKDFFSYSKGAFLIDDVKKRHPNRGFEA